MAASVNINTGVLGLIAENYESSSGEESDQEDQQQPTKRKTDDDIPQPKKIKTDENSSDLKFEPENNDSVINPKFKNNALPRVPSTICSMFSSRVDGHEDDSSLHQGRVRTFQHEAGNWATHVYVPLEAEAVFHKLVNCVVTLCSRHGMTMNSPENFHLSISRTVVIRHHWIEPLINQLHKKFSLFAKFLIALKFLDVYTNDAKTRTFIGIKPDTGFLQLKNATNLVDECFAEFKLQEFYKPPSFHVSIAWCNGDESTKLIQLMPQIQECCEDFMQKSCECRNLLVSKFELKSGNKLFPIPLK